MVKRSTGECLFKVILIILPAFLIGTYIVFFFSNSPLSNVDNVVISGNVSTRNGNGDGSVGAAWRRTTSYRNWFEVDAKLGSNTTSSATYFHRLTAKTFVNMSGDNVI